MSLDTEYINSILEERLAFLNKMLPVAYRVAFVHHHADEHMVEDAEELYFNIRSEIGELRFRLGKKGTGHSNTP